MDSKKYQLHEMVVNLKKIKTEVMLFGLSQQLKKGRNLLNVMYEGNTIILWHEYNYLGTITDSHLNFNKNFNCSYKPASTRLRLLGRLRPYLTVDATIKSLLVYDSFNFDISFHYTNTLWWYSMQKTSITWPLHQLYYKINCDVNR